MATTDAGTAVNRHTTEPTPTQAFDDDVPTDSDALAGQRGSRIARLSSSAVMSATSEKQILGFDTIPEHPEPVQLAVKGTFPPWLAGTLWRTGPGKYDIVHKDGSPYDISHWFDGHGMLHAFQLNGASNSVLYRSRHTTHELDERISNSGPNMNLIRFHRPTDPCKSAFAKMFTTFKMLTGMGDTVAPYTANSKSSSNVAVTVDPNFAAIGTMGLPSKNDQQGQPLVTRTDANVLAVFDPETLEPLKTLSYRQFDKSLKGALSAAHGVDIGGTYYNYTLDFGATPAYKVFALSPADEKTGKSDTQILACIKDLPASYLHSLAATDRYVILTIWECDFAWNGIKILSTASVTGGFAPWAGRRTYHVVVDRVKGGEVARFESPPMFVFHHFNAFDRVHADGSVDIVLDLAAWGNNSVVSALTLDSLRHGTLEDWHRAVNKPTRVVLPSVSKTRNAKEIQEAKVFTYDGEPGSDTKFNAELPVVNPNYAWKPSRFGYGIHIGEGAKQQGTIADSIIKLDMEALEHGKSPSTGLVWSDGNSAGELVPGEPIFVPRPIEAGGTGAEDDGVLLVVALDSQARRSLLYAIDARDMSTIASADVANIVPLGFHGAYKSKI